MSFSQVSELIQKNSPPAVWEKIRSRTDEFNTMYRDVKKGDRYRTVYQPGKGTTLFLNQQELGTVEDREFSEAFFGMWIGKTPIDTRFRDKLLGLIK